MAKGSPGFYLEDPVREGIPGREMLKSRRTSRNTLSRGARVAQSVKCPTSAQVMISQLVRSSPASGSVLTA